MRYFLLARCLPLRPDHNHRLPLLVGRIHDHQLRHTGDFVHLLLHGDAFDQVLEVHCAADFGQDRERVGIPFEQDLVGLDGRAVLEQDARAVNHLVALLLAALFIHHGDYAVAVHGDQLAGLVATVAMLMELGESVGFRVLRGLLAERGGRAADVERTHGELRAGLAD